MGTTAKVSDRDVMDALMNLPGTTTLDQERLDRNIILPKSAGLHPGQVLNPSIDIPISFKPGTPERELEAADTIHYISPASVTPLSPRTENEGDFALYETPSFMKLISEHSVSEGSYVTSTISCVEPELQRTLAIIKPEAMEYEDVIMRAIVDAGFAIIHKRHLHFTPEQVSEIYSQYYGSPSFPFMVVKMSVGPILSVCMAAMNAVEKWKNLVGPERAVKTEWFFPISMRARFGLHGDIADALHASENIKDARKETRYVDPESIQEPIMVEENQVCDYCNTYINPTLVKALTEVVRAKPVDPIIHLADCLLKSNPYQPRFPQDINALPT